MRIRCGTIFIAVVALAVGAAAGWFAARAWGKCKCENVVVCKYGNMEAANAGRPSAPDGRAVSMKPPKEKAKPRRKTEANVEKQREPEVVKPEEKPAQEGNAAQKKNDNPFPRYLDMFKNNPEALTAERLYEQLEFSGISDADAQNIIYRAAYNTSFSYECLEPSLQIYDKVYKNMGVGNDIFSWCSRARRQGGK